jgi:hypothetical protein
VDREPILGGVPVHEKVVKIFVLFLLVRIEVSEFSFGNPMSGKKYPNPRKVALYLKS